MTIDGLVADRYERIPEMVRKAIRPVTVPVGIAARLMNGYLPHDIRHLMHRLTIKNRVIEEGVSYHAPIKKRCEGDAIRAQSSSFLMAAGLVVSTFVYSRLLHQSESISIAMLATAYYLSVDMPARIFISNTINKNNPNKLQYIVLAEVKRLEKEIEHGQPEKEIIGTLVFEVPYQICRAGYHVARAAIAKISRHSNSTAAGL